MIKEARGECPECGMPIPFGQTVKRRGKPFACQACGAALELAKPNLLLLMPLIAMALLVAKLAGFLAFVFVATLIAVGDWKFARTRTGETGEQA